MTDIITTVLGDIDKWKGLELPVVITLVLGIVIIFLGLAFLRSSGQRERYLFDLVKSTFDRLSDLSDALTDLSANIAMNTDEIKEIKAMMKEGEMIDIIEWIKSEKKDNNVTGQN